MKEVITVFDSDEERENQLSELRLAARVIVTFKDGRKDYVILPEDKKDQSPIIDYIAHVDKDGQLTINEWAEKNRPDLVPLIEQIRERFAA